MKRRIAVCISKFEAGGQGTVVEEELAYLRHRWDVTLIANVISRSVPEHVRILQLNPWKPFPKINTHLVALLSEFDLVHCHDSLAFMYAATRAHRPAIITAHGIAPARIRSGIRSMLGGVVTRVLYPRLYRRVSAVVGISEYICQWIERVSKVKPEFIPNGTSSVVASAERMTSDRRILYVGEISRRKAIGQLLEGVAGCPPDVTLDVVGHGNPRPIFRQAARLGIIQRVRFHGEVPRDRLEQLFKECFCTGSASLWEGFGLPILEGFGFGRPALARNRGGMAELIKGSGAGCLFDDVSEIPNCVAMITDQWDYLSRRALVYAAHRTWDDSFGGYIHLFDQVLRESVPS